MGSTTTLKNEPGAYCKPRKETIQFLLNYSKALEVKKLASGEYVEFIRNWLKAPVSTGAFILQRVL